VCSVFERVNTGGVVLNVFELLTARTRATASTQKEWRGTSTSPITGGAKARLSAAYPVLGTLENGQETGLTSIDFLQTISWSTRITSAIVRRLGTQSAANAGTVRLPLNDSCGGTCCRGRIRLGRGFSPGNGLPDRGSSVSDTAGTARRDPCNPRNRTDEFELQIARWYWCGVLGELYGGATESRFPGRRAGRRLAGRRRSPDTVAEATFQEQRLETWQPQ